MGKSTMKNFLSEAKSTKEKKGKSKIKDVLSNIPTGLTSEVTGGPNPGLLDLAQSFVSNN